jgi:hypothetical protein
MNVANINQFGFYLIVGIEVFFMYKYAAYWLQILSALKDEDGELSMNSQKELNDAAARGNLKQGYAMILSSMAVSAKILFSSKTDNPKLTVPVKGIRRTLLLAVLAPMIIMFALIFITALMQ